MARLDTSERRRGTSSAAQRLETLRRIEILHSLGDAELEALGAQCTWRVYRTGQQVIARESKDRHVYFVVHGAVRVCLYSAAGRELAFRDVRAGKCFGEISAIDALPRSANVEAIEETTIASVPPQHFWSLLERHPGVMASVVRLLTATIRSLSDRLFELSTLGIQNRVHAEVLRLAKEAGVHGAMASVDPAPRHADIASRISANREQVTKELSAMARQGLVERRGRVLVVPDIARLERIVAEVRRNS
jgi:CRP-like cAMP-binding protein